MALRALCDINLCLATACTRHKCIMLSVQTFIFTVLTRLQAPNNTGCACPNDVLSYTCTAVGAGITVWEVKALDCTIVLRHNLFDSGSAFGECNDENIVGRSVGVDDDCYTSQLDVTVNLGLNNKNISCIHNSAVGVNTVGTSSLFVVEGQCYNI